MNQIETSKEEVIRSRAERVGKAGPTLSSIDQDTLVHQYHPDYNKAAYREILIGPNCGERTVHEPVSYTHLTLPTTPYV